MTDAALPVPRRLPPVLMGAGLMAAGVALMLVAGLAVGRWPFAFDRAILLTVRDWSGPPWVRGVADVITDLGGATVLTPAVLLVAALLVALGHRLTALAIMASTWSGGLAVSALKAAVGRPRPAVVEHWAFVNNASFPSGHAADSAVVYLTLAAVATQLVRGRRARNAILAFAILLVGAIGLSRIYLGVHWPSDVLAGWSFGTLWAIGWWKATAAARKSLARE